jgi:hypothetical protein
MVLKQLRDLEVSGDKSFQAVQRRIHLKRVLSKMN